MEPTPTATAEQLLEHDEVHDEVTTRTRELLVEEISIDGMCGVY